MTFRVAIAGASGYAGGELARLLSAHPGYEVTTLAAHTAAGQPVSAVHPHLSSFADATFVETSVDTLRGHDVVALALPHGESGALGDALSASGDQVVLVDLGADRRLESSSDWDQFYGGNFCAPFTYGMPELVRATGPTSRELLSETRTIAVPGCNATAVTLALTPLLARGVIRGDDISAVLAVGSSGAGRSLRSDLLAAEVTGSARPYAVGGIHRHLPEIRQNFATASGLNTSVSMTPVLVPMSRGILATCSAPLVGSPDLDEVHSVLVDAYAGEPFIRVYDQGLFPATGDVLGSNTLALGVSVDAAVNRVIVVAALDNLVKGTAGAALQSVNLALGLEESSGLATDGIAP